METRKPVHVHDLHDRSNLAKRFNAWLAVKITGLVGTMWCAYVFAALALISLPNALSQGTSVLISWIAQTFLQLVLLSVIMVGQDVQAKASDARSEQTFEDTERILDALDVHTEGGLKDILDRIEKLQALASGSGGETSNLAREGSTPSWGTSLDRPPAG